MIEFMLSSGFIAVVELLIRLEMSQIFFFSVCQHRCTDLQKTGNLSNLHMHSSHVADYFFTYTNQCVAFAAYAGGKMHVCVLIFKQRLWGHIAVVFIG